MARYGKVKSVNREIANATYTAQRLRFVHGKYYLHLQLVVKGVTSLR